MSALNATSPNDSQVVDGPMSLGVSTNGESSLLPSLVLRRPSANMFVADSIFYAFVEISLTFFCRFFCVSVTDEFVLFSF